MNNQQLVRYNAGQSRNQGVAEEYEVQLEDGTLTTAWHPPVLTEGITAFYATSNNFGKGERYNEWYLGYTADGTYGIVSTCKNSCKQYASIAGCRYGDSCHFYHVEPGYIMTNLPKRTPLIIGRIDGRLGNSTKMVDLTAWNASNNADINRLNDAHNEVTLAKARQARADVVIREEKAAALEQALADIHAGRGEPVRKKPRFNLPVPMKPPGSPQPLSPQFSDAPVVTPVSYVASPDHEEGEEPGAEAGLPAVPDEDALFNEDAPDDENATICALMGQV